MIIVVNMVTAMIIKIIVIVINILLVGDGDVGNSVAEAGIQLISARAMIVIPKNALTVLIKKIIVIIFLTN